MPRLFIRLSLFYLGGTLVAWLVSGDATPLLIAIVALVILWKIFDKVHGSGK